MFRTNIDDFGKERLTHIAYYIGILFISIIIFYQIYLYALNNNLAHLLPIIYVIFVSFFVGAMIVTGIRLPYLRVNTQNLTFTYYGKNYNFDNLLPTYNVKKSGYLKYTFFLYFKDGTSVKMTLAKAVAIVFAEKYLNKYSKPDSSISI